MVAMAGWVVRLAASGSGTIPREFEDKDDIGENKEGGGREESKGEVGRGGAEELNGSATRLYGRDGDRRVVVEMGSAKCTC